MQLQNILADIEALKKETDALLPLSKEAEEKLRKKLRLEFHYNTNHIEGNTLTYGETELLFLHDEIRGRHTTREIDEMKASEVALRMVEDLAADSERPLTESFIKDLNRVLLKEPFYKEAITPDGQRTSRLIEIGDYKKHPNNARLPNGELFRFASVEEAPALMTDLIDWYREREAAADTHPVLLAATLHYRFVRIHPFDDGNGRASRLLMNYVLLRAGYPLAIVRTEDKTGYLSALHDADAGNVESFVGYIGQQCIASLELLRKAAIGESIEEEEDWKKELALMTQSFGKSGGIERGKSVDSVRNVIEVAMAELVPRVENSLKEFSELFVRIRGRFDGITFSENEDENAALDILKIIPSNQVIERRLLGGFGYVFSLEGFKQSTEHPFTVKHDLQWDLQDFRYKVNYGFPATNSSNNLLTKLYHETIRDNEAREIANYIARRTIQAISQQLKQIELKRL